MRSAWVPVAMVAAALLAMCGDGDDGEGDDDDVTPAAIPARGMSHVLLAWNDLGMHCLNPTYDRAVILPPYNTVWAQLVERGDPPTVVTSGASLSYELVGNTTSMGKTDSFGGDFDQFWENSETLFGVALEPDTGLNLVSPALHNGLSGTMVSSGKHFEVDGIPVVPVLDDGTWDPYQVVEIIARDAGGEELARTRATVPTSDELDCAKCHGENGEATEEIGGGTADVFANILALHDADRGTHLVDDAPVLCASCHGSPALGTEGPGAAGYLSRRIHSKHAEEDPTPACYDCHPGERTRCSRSTAHTAGDGNCSSCHGTLTEVGGSIARGDRTPWVDEPKCVTCHDGATRVDTGSTLYRHAEGHGGLNCAACHGSPHAMVPSEEPKDEHQAMQYQGAAMPLGSCQVCHGTARFDGGDDFAEEHAGAEGEPSACNVCHTVTPSSLSGAPHRPQ